MDRMHVLSALAAGLGLLLSVAAGPAPGQTSDQKAEAARHLKQLLANFDAWDTNHDGYLDKAELARAFRGPQAAPFDARPATGRGGKAVPRPVGPTATVLLVIPPPAPPVNYALAELLTRTDLRKHSLPDYQLFTLVAKPGQARISRKSFTTWAKKYSRSAGKVLKAEQALQKAEAKVQKAQQGLRLAQAKVQQAKTTRAAQSAQKEVQRRLKDLEKAQAGVQKRLQELNNLVVPSGNLSPELRRVLVLK
jgi:hypothetical protein